MSQQQIGGSASPMMCAAGCSFFGSPATLGMCSVCYKKHCCTMTDSPGAATAAVARSTPTTATPGPDAAAGSAAAAEPTVAASVCSVVAPAAGEGAVAEAAAPAALPEAAAAKKKAAPGRCAACRKKVGLVAGFVCRCGETFCGSHRYAEEHGCSFDFKGASRDAIARANPVVKADKLADKI